MFYKWELTPPPRSDGEEVDVAVAEALASAGLRLQQPVGERLRLLGVALRLHVRKAVVHLPHVTVEHLFAHVRGQAAQDALVLGFVRGLEELLLGAELGGVDAVFPQHVRFLARVSVVTRVLHVAVVFVRRQGDGWDPVVVVGFVDEVTTSWRSVGFVGVGRCDGDDVLVFVERVLARQLRLLHGLDHRLALARRAHL